jgi:hypothetical protein
LLFSCHSHFDFENVFEKILLGKTFYKANFS